MFESPPPHLEHLWVLSHCYKETSQRPIIGASLETKLVVAAGAQSNNPNCSTVKSVNVIFSMKTTDSY